MVLVAMTFWGEESDRLDVPRDLFSIVNTNDISDVKFSTSSSNEMLQFDGSRWLVNQKYKADPQRVTVLFSVMKQLKVRKKVSRQLQGQVDSLFQLKGVTAEFSSGQNLKKKFSVVGDEDRRVTYFNDGTETYIVQIPGYNVYLANIFELDENGWRDPLAFNLDWINLSSVDMIYPEKPDQAFKVSFIDRQYIMDGVAQPDSLKVTDFLDDVSRLFVNDYLFTSELGDYKEFLDNLQATVVVSDVGKNDYTIEFFEKVDGNQIIARIDSTQYALIDYRKVKKILKPKSFFKLKRADQ